ncbi:MAG: pilus assembly protein PilM [Planctomycetota bacterium]
MGFWRFPWQGKIGPIGLDLGGDRPRAIQVRVGADEPFGLGESAGLRAGDLEARAWAGVEAIRNGRFSGREVVVGLPPSAARMHVIRMPAIDGEDGREAVAWEASERCGVERGSIVADSVPTGAPAAVGDDREERIVVAASHEELLAAFNVLIVAGFEPMAAEPRFASIARALARRTRRGADASVVRAVLHLEHDSATVLVIRGEQVAFCREISIGGATLDGAVAARLGVSEDDARELRRTRMAAQAGDGAPVDAVAEEAALLATRPVLDALAAEVALCLRYYGVTFRGGQPNRVVLSGPHAFEPRLAEIVGETCRADIAMFAEDLPSAAAPAGPRAFSSWIAAFGLACRSLDHPTQERAA